MKYIIFFILTINAYGNDYNLWVNNKAKVLNVYVNSRVKLNLEKLAVSDRYYAQISLESEDKLLDRKQKEKIELDYPQYKIKYISDSLIDESATLIIGDFKHKSLLLFSPNGVKLNDLFYITKTDFYSIKKELNSNNKKISIHYKTEVNLLIEDQVETYTLDADTCDSLFLFGSKMSDVMSEFNKLISDLNKHSFRYQTTKLSLIKNVERSCIKHTKETYSTVYELMNKKLIKLKNEHLIKGQTFKSHYVQKIVNLKPEILL